MTWLHGIMHKKKGRDADFVIKCTIKLIRSRQPGIISLPRKCSVLHNTNQSSEQDMSDELKLLKNLACSPAFFIASPVAVPNEVSQLMLSTPSLTACNVLFSPKLNSIFVAVALPNCIRAICVLSGPISNFPLRTFNSCLMLSKLVLLMLPEPSTR